MNVVLLVVDSLRACSLGRAAAGGPRTPFLDRLASEFPLDVRHAPWEISL